VTVGIGLPDGRMALVTSPALLAELAEVMRRPKFGSVLARSHSHPEQIREELFARWLQRCVKPRFNAEP